MAETEVETQAESPTPKCYQRRLSSGKRFGMRGARLQLFMAIAFVCPAAQSVRLVPQAQKVRTFYALNDPAVPRELKGVGARLPRHGVVASDGAGAS